MYKVVHEAPVLPFQVDGANRPRFYDAIIANALAKDPNRRYATAEDSRLPWSVGVGLGAHRHHGLGAGRRWPWPPQARPPRRAAVRRSATRCWRPPPG
jgi:hypothetical protein